MFFMLCLAKKLMTSCRSSVGYLLNFLSKLGLHPMGYGPSPQRGNQSKGRVGIICLGNGCMKNATEAAALGAPLPQSALAPAAWPTTLHVAHTRGCHPAEHSGQMAWYTGALEMV